MFRAGIAAAGLIIADRFRQALTAASRPHVIQLVRRHHQLKVGRLRCLS